MKFVLILTICLFMTPFVANASKDIHIIINKKMSKSKIKKAFPYAKVYDSADQMNARRTESMPQHMQVELFKKMKITKIINKYDAFDKDLLVRKIRSFKLPYLRKKYPKISIKKIKFAKRYIANYDKKYLK